MQQAGELTITSHHKQILITETLYSWLAKQGGYKTSSSSSSLTDITDIQQIDIKQSVMAHSSDSQVTLEIRQDIPQHQRFLLVNYLYAANILDNILGILSMFFFTSFENRD